ncbi:profilin, required for normal timing of actin polymerization in response to thermal stress [Geranomyces variabilis]|nr:profilin [Geranomyces variabilis]KAJ3142298.1 profilin, required for normal timing of actin polymerization in response to thermal stress [Geranomyces variabilis]KAJ3156561.1 profilin, required for normal timing of actin polymerization in response to thermal stress [Geranomyces variabilis]KAJ3168965.1 profilin, required for normal timing of actin polymerization in response to thermal stress [Geranomyces variabilis]
MSWQAYVDSNLLGTGKIAKAAIFGLDGSLWATSSNLSVQAPEISALSKGFTDPSGLRASGIYIAGTKYFTLRADDKAIYGKQGQNGLCAAKTKQAIIVGIYESPVQAGDANKVVEGLADYLIGVNY